MFTHNRGIQSFVVAFAALMIGGLSGTVQARGQETNAQKVARARALLAHARRVNAQNRTGTTTTASTPRQYKAPRYTAPQQGLAPDAMQQQIARLRAERASRSRQSDSYRALDELARNRDPRRTAALHRRAFPNSRPPRTAAEKMGAKAGTAAGMSGALGSFH